MQGFYPERADTGDEQRERQEAERPVNAEAGKGGCDDERVQGKVADGDRRQDDGDSAFAPGEPEEEADRERQRRDDQPEPDIREFRHMRKDRAVEVNAQQLSGEEGQCVDRSAQRRAAENRDTQSGESPRKQVGKDGVEMQRLQPFGKLTVCERSEKLREHRAAKAAEQTDKRRGEFRRRGFALVRFAYLMKKYHEKYPSFRIMVGR